MEEFCINHKDVRLKNRKDKKGKFCPVCAGMLTARGRGKFRR